MVQVVPVIIVYKGEVENPVVSQDWISQEFQSGTGVLEDSCSLHWDPKEVGSNICDGYCTIKDRLPNKSDNNWINGIVSFFHVLLSWLPPQGVDQIWGWSPCLIWLRKSFADVPSCLRFSWFQMQSSWELGNKINYHTIYSISLDLGLNH